VRTHYPRTKRYPMAATLPYSGMAVVQTGSYGEGYLAPATNEDQDTHTDPVLFDKNRPPREERRTGRSSLFGLVPRC